MQMMLSSVLWLARTINENKNWQGIQIRRRASRSRNRAPYSLFFSFRVQSALPLL